MLRDSVRRKALSAPLLGIERRTKSSESAVILRCVKHFLSCYLPKTRPTSLSFHASRTTDTWELCFNCLARPSIYTSIHTE
jgi:hypothetical protein